MCEQCIVDARYFYKKPDETFENEFFLPGWCLIQATKDGHIMKVGDWGLLQINNPDFVWEVEPISDPTFDMDDDAEEAALKDPEIKKKSDLYFERLILFQDALFGCAISGWRLVNAAITTGYDKNELGSFASWLFHQLGCWIETHEATSFYELPLVATTEKCDEKCDD